MGLAWWYCIWPKCVPHRFMCWQCAPRELWGLQEVEFTVRWWNSQHDPQKCFCFWEDQSAPASLPAPCFHALSCCCQGALPHEALPGEKKWGHTKLPKLSSSKSMSEIDCFLLASSFWYSVTAIEEWTKAGDSLDWDRPDNIHWSWWNWSTCIQSHAVDVQQEEMGVSGACQLSRYLKPLCHSDLNNPVFPCQVWPSLLFMENGHSSQNAIEFFILRVIAQSTNQFLYRCLLISPNTSTRGHVSFL